MAWSEQARRAAIEARRRKRGLSPGGREKMARALREQRSLSLSRSKRKLGRTAIKANNDYYRYEAQRSLRPVKGRDY